MSCLFCNLYTHDIGGCDYSKLPFIFKRVEDCYLAVITQEPQHNQNRRFKAIITNNFTNLALRVIADKYANAGTVTTMEVVTDVLWEYFSSIYDVHNEQAINGILPTHPDQIPYFANDLAVANDEVNIVVSRASLAPQSFQVKNYYYNISSFLVKQKKDEQCENEEECAICFENINSLDMVKLNCDHNFCGKCIIKTLNTFNNNGLCVPGCAFCRVPMKSLSVKNPEIYKTLVSEHCM